MDNNFNVSFKAIPNYLWQREGQSSRGVLRYLKNYLPECTNAYPDKTLYFSYFSHRKLGIQKTNPMISLHLSNKKKHGTKFYEGGEVFIPNFHNVKRSDYQDILTKVVYIFKALVERDECDKEIKLLEKEIKQLKKTGHSGKIAEIQEKISKLEQKFKEKIEQYSKDEPDVLQLLKKEKK